MFPIPVTTRTLLSMEVLSQSSALHMEISHTVSQFRVDKSIPTYSCMCVLFVIYGGRMILAPTGFALAPLQRIT